MSGREKQSIRSVLIFGAFAAVVAFAVPFYFWDSIPAYDWNYFNPLSLVTRSTVLHYHTLPIHNPWVCGGVDNLANPQSRILSPFVFLDILLPPEWANLTSLFLLSLLGFVGMYRLLQFWGVKHKSALILAFVFINGSYFALHFSEGHITFGPVLLLPWSLYLFLRWTEPFAFFLLCLLHVFYLYSGANYAFIFSLLLCGFYALFFPSILWKGFKRSKRVFAIYALILLTSSFLALIKVIPLLDQFTHRSPELDFGFVPIKMAFEFLTKWDFAQFHQPEGLKYRAHEFACHLSWLGALLCFLFLFKKDFIKKNFRTYLLFVLWVSVAFGWGGPLNPWHFFQRIPVINNAHVQSRVLILAFIFFLLLVGQLLSRFEGKPLLWGLFAIFLLGEASFVRNFPVYQAYKMSGVPSPTTALITSGTLTGNVPMAWDKFHYFTGKSSRGCYEPAQPKGLPTFNANDWEQMAVVKEGTGAVLLEKYGPGLMTVRYQGTGPLTLELRTNYLAGWSTKASGVTVFRTLDGLVGLSVPHGSGVVELSYSPSYGKVVLASLGFALLGLIWLVSLRFWQLAPYWYGTIPPGFYDKAFREGGRVRRHWHETKFRRVLDLFPDAPEKSILDIGCAAGTFLSLVPEAKFSKQVGVDLSTTQVAYANEHYGTNFRSFFAVQNPTDLTKLEGTFDVITLIEVIEHLTPVEIKELFEAVAQKMKMGGILVITTPNYASLWPFLEMAVNLISEVGYWDQHITRFNYYNLERKINRLMGRHKKAFKVEFKTTSHFLTPFLAGISPSLAAKLSRAVEAKHWKGRFGCLNLIVFKKVSESEEKETQVA